jgi:hypothetical protein
MARNSKSLNIPITADASGVKKGAKEAEAARATD